MTAIAHSNLYFTSDDALILFLGAFLKEERIKQNRSQEETATAAGISRSALSSLENGGPAQLITFIRVLRVLNQLHILQAFNPETTLSPIRLAKLEGKKRQRAGRKNKNNTALPDNW